MIKIERCRDIEYIKSVMFSDEMWERCANDYSVKHQMLEKMTCVWLKCYKDGKAMGLATVRAIDEVCVSVHIHILKENRGKHTIEIGRNILSWIKENANSRIQKLTTSIPVIYKDVIRFAHHLGFKDEGINRKSIMKNGKLIDRLNLGLMREDIA